MAIARLQKWGGVHKNKMTDNTTASGVIIGLTAADPARVAKLPAKPPITIFHLSLINISEPTRQAEIS